MRFLCLHGVGTSSQIFEMQTAAIRHELGEHHEFEFVEGSLPYNAGPGMTGMETFNDEFFAYFDEELVDTIRNGIMEIDSYIETEGPFDGVMAFSQGAGLAAMAMIRSHRAKGKYPFKCGIFFSGEMPADPANLEQGQLRLMSEAADGVVINIPTAHIWGSNDKLFPEFGPIISGLCESSTKSIYIHDGGHEVPGTKSKDAVTKSVHAIRRTIAFAEAG